MKFKPTLTNYLIIFIAVMAFVNFATKMSLIPFTGLSLKAPWTIFTWTLFTEYPTLWLIFSGLFLYAFGNEVERIYGSRAFGALVLIFTVVGGAALMFGAAVLNLVQPFWFGSSILSMSIFMVFAAIHPKHEICIGLGIRCQAQWLAIGYTLLMIVNIGTLTGLPGYGLFGLVPLLLGRLMGLGKVPVPFSGHTRTALGERKTKKERVNEQAEFDEFITKVRDKASEREEKERLRKLFENSLKDDPEDRQAK